MRYYAQYNEDNKLIAIGTGFGGEEISKEEYDRIFSEIQEKAVLVNNLYNNEISVENIPEEWREEIQRRVNERIEMEALLAEQEAVEPTENTDALTNNT